VGLKPGPDARLAEFLGRVLFALVVGVVGLLAIDGVSALIGLGKFGHISGWIAGLLAVWTFAEEFRAWAGVPFRFWVAAGSAVFGVLLGSLAAGLVDFLPPLGAGAVAASVAALVYMLVWFIAMHWVLERCDR
jgi:hypothetical protein